MTTTILRQMATGSAPPVFAFNVEQYHEMNRTGILPDGAPVELIDGLLVLKDRSARGADPMTISPRHGLAITLLMRLERFLDPFGCHMRVQLPVTLSESSEPEPDIAVMRGEPRLFANRHPGSDDVVAVIEVAESSLRFDRTSKQRVYARAGIGQYWVVDLKDDCVEVCHGPQVKNGRYRKSTVYRPGRVISLQLGKQAQIQVAVNDILPQRAE